MAIFTTALAALGLLVVPCLEVLLMQSSRNFSSLSMESSAEVMILTFLDLILFNDYV